MPWARVEANVRLPLELAGMPNAKADPLVKDAIAHVGLAAFNRLFRGSFPAACRCASRSRARW